MALSTISLKSLHSLIDRIRRLVDPTAVVSADVLDECYRDYDEAIREANDRLHECDELLRDGHRAQALQRCEQDPDLLQVAALLDFAERPLWHAMLQEAGYSAPPPVQLDVAAELNEAYNLEKPLTDLMRMHRLHALAGSPLKTRLGFLRKIAERDPGTAIWREDLHSYERARHLQIEQELSEAEKKRDASLAAQLEREVAASEWDEKPPPPLVESAVRIHTQLRQARARERIKAIAGQLHDAAAGRDEARAQQLRLAWNGQIAIAQLGASDPLLEEVEPVFDWLDREEARRQQDKSHKAAIVALEQALDAGAKRIDLERAYNEVGRYGAVPEELDRKVQLRVDLLERRGRLRLVAGVVVTLAMLAVATGGIFWYIRASGQVAEFRRRVTALEQLVDAGKRTEAAALLARFKAKAPQTYSAPEIQTLAGKLQVLEQKERDRVAARERTISTIQAAIDEDVWQRLEQAMPEIAAAEKLCATEVERREVQDLLTALRAGIRKHQQASDDAFTKELRELAAKVDRASGADRTTIAQLKAEAANLSTRARVSPDLRRQAQPLIARLDTLATTDDARRREELALQQLRESIGNVGGYVAALDNYAKGFPQTARAAAFARASADEQALWAAVEPWNRLAAKWSQTDFRRLTPADAKLLVTELDATVQTHGAFPAAARLQSLLPYLEAIQRRVNDAGERVHKELLVVLEDPRVKDLAMLYTIGSSADKKRFYFSETTEKPPQPDPIREGYFVVIYFKDPQLQDTKRASLPAIQIANAPRGTGYECESPQRRIYIKVTRALDLVGDANWEATFFSFLAALRAEREMEPTLKLHLTQLFLNYGCQGSHCLAQGFKPWLDILANTQADIEANWIDPDDPLGKKARQAASDKLDRLLDLDGCGKAAAAHLASLAPQVRGPQYTWIGSLLKDNGGQWAPPAPLLAANASGPLVVLRKDSAGGIAAQPIGRAEGGKLVLDMSAADALTEGRPIFLANE